MCREMTYARYGEAAAALLLAAMSAMPCAPRDDDAMAGRLLPRCRYAMMRCCAMRVSACRAARYARYVERYMRYRRDMLRLRMMRASLHLPSPLRQALL